MWSLILFCLVVAPQVICEDSNEVAGRILGGHEAVIEKYPYQVFLYSHHNITNKDLYCDGFIISKNYIVTAAHCVRNTSSLNVRAGSTYRNNATFIPIANFTVHPKYGKDLSPIDPDVAVLQTVNPIQFNDTIQPIKLADAYRRLYDYTNFTFSGWGAVGQEDKQLSNRLMAVNLTVIPVTLCAYVYGILITENMFCAGSYSKGRPNACQGDDGGAGVQDGVAVGFATYGSSCGTAHRPSVFTNIAAPTIRKFIKNITGI